MVEFCVNKFQGLGDWGLGLFINEAFYKFFRVPDRYFVCNVDSDRLLLKLSLS